MKNISNHKKILILVILSLTLTIWGYSQATTEQHDHKNEHREDEHEGHEHTEIGHTENKHEEKCDGSHQHTADEHKEEKEHANHDDHEYDDEHSEFEVTLTEQAMKLAGIKFSNVKMEKIANTIEFPGEISLNEDNVAEITPRFAGVAKVVKGKLGAYVQEGDVLAVVEGNESFTQYKVKSPISGYIIEKNITRGEFLGEEESIYVIADLKTVWVNCEVYPKSANHIKIGQIVKINAVGSQQETIGKISYISPIFDESTRSSMARIEIPSENRSWRPGMFITASLKIDSKKSVPVVQKNAVQVLHEKNVIFIPEENNTFEPIEVVLGKSDDKYVEVLKGIHSGEQYVSDGAFEIKAKIVTSALGDHAGHGH